MQVAAGKSSTARTTATTGTPVTAGMFAKVWKPSSFLVDEKIFKVLTLLLRNFNFILFFFLRNYLLILKILPVTHYK
jgi:hypothetical protein